MVKLPLTKKGKTVLSAMKRTYGAKKGKEVFYASIQKGKPGTEKWHKGKAASSTKMTKDDLAEKALKRIS